MSDFSANNSSAKYTPCQHLRSARRNNIVLLRCMPNKSHFDQMEKRFAMHAQVSRPASPATIVRDEGYCARNILFLCNAYPKSLTTCGAIFHNSSGTPEHRTSIEQFTVGTNLSFRWSDENGRNAPECRVRYRNATAPAVPNSP